MRINSALGLIISVILGGPSLAFAVPAQVSQQGRLVDDSGDGIDGSHSIEFSLFSDSDGATVVWSETITLDLDAGYYSAVLGADTTNPLDAAIFSVQPLYLGMSVDSGTLMQPLLEVTSAPYAIGSEVSTNLDGGYADASSLFIDGTLVVDGNGDWVGNVLPGTLASLGCTDGEEARYTSLGGWVCAHPGEHYTNAQAITAMGAIDNGNPLNHSRYTAAEALADLGPHYTNAEAVAAVSAADDYVRNTGDTVTGALTLSGGSLTVQNTQAAISLDNTGAGGTTGAEWSIEANGQDLKIVKPSILGTSTTNIRIVNASPGSIKLTPRGNPALTADGNGDVTADRYIFGERYLFNARSNGTVGLNGVIFLNSAQVHFAHQLVDRGNVYDGVSTFTARRNGYYSFTMSFTFSSGDGRDDTLELRFVKNWTPNGGTSLQTLTTNPRSLSRASKETNASMTTIVQLNAGDRVCVAGYNMELDSPAIITRGYFSGFYLGD